MAAPRPLLGRDSELASLTALLEPARRGAGGLAWIEGEAGIGKTRLIAAAVEVAREQGLAVLAAGAEELESHRPFGVVSNGLGVDRRSADERRAEVARALYATPEREHAPLLQGGGALTFAVAEQLLGLVEDLCADTPTMLVLDDLQWADPSSLTFVGRLAHELGALPLVLVAAMRRGPRPVNEGRSVEDHRHRRDAFQRRHADPDAGRRSPRRPEPCPRVDRRRRVVHLQGHRDGDRRPRKPGAQRRRHGDVLQRRWSERRLDP